MRPEPVVVGLEATGATDREEARMLCDELMAEEAWL